MKNLLLVLIFCLFPYLTASAEVKEYVYDGKEIYLHVKKDHMTTIIFPEPINQVIRGFGADTYIIQRKDKEPNTLEVMPTDLEAAEMSVSGISGEDYVLRFVAKDDFYTKVTILAMPTALDKADLLNEAKTIVVKKNTLSTVIPPPAKAVNDLNHESGGHGANLPAALNLKITLKGNDLPLKVYLSTIAEVTKYNVITTPEIDSQKTSINLENIEIWRALNSILYPFGFGFKVSQEDLIITETETKIFNITMPAVDQSFIDETSNESFADNTNNNNTSTVNQQNQDIKVGTKIYYENSSPKLSLWTDLENNVKAMITPKTGSYSINKVSGSIIDSYNKFEYHYLDNIIIFKLL